MTIRTLSSRGLERQAFRALEAAERWPVFIRTKGQDTHVLLSFEEYRRLTSRLQGIVDSLDAPDGADNDPESCPVEVPEPPREIGATD